MVSRYVVDIKRFEDVRIEERKPTVFEMKIP
jgi:hypothetical protein